jgi:SAM-dependent methyltransferase
MSDLMPDDLNGERMYLRAPGRVPNILHHVMAYARALPLVVSKSVLDIGCGTGYGTKLLSEAADRILGVDYSKVAIDYAKLAVPLNCEFRLCDVEKELPVWKPDIITCFQVLEHLDDPSEIVSKYDCPWVFAVPNGGVTITGHHHDVTEDLIQKWFSGKAKLLYFDDDGFFYKTRPSAFTNFFGVYTP